MFEALLLANAVLIATTLVVATIVLIVQLRTSRERLSPDAIGRAMRDECDHVRRESADHARAARGELAERFDKFQGSIVHAFGILGQSIDGHVRGFGGKLGEGMAGMNGRVDAIKEKLDRDISQMGTEASASRDVLREAIEKRLVTHAQAQDAHAKALREEVGTNVRSLGQQHAATLADMGLNQKERLETVERALRTLTEQHVAAQEGLRQSVESRLDVLRQENTAKLDEMRQTVDEKLQSTLEARLGESFTRVVEQLNRVHEGLGEMKSLASNVGDLKSVLTNVKVRGTYGEVQLELILEQMLAPQQYMKNAQVRENTGERVEFAIRLPGRSIGEEVLLPIDAKFPREIFERLLEAGTSGETELVLALRKELETKIRGSAKTICDKYIVPPRTTDFAIMFLPTEGLYAEVLRQPGLFERLQRDHKITVAGPTTLAAILNALRMGFQTLAIEKKSSEVWKVLGEVKTAFDGYNKTVETLANNLDRAVNSVDALSKSTRKVTKALKTVEALPITDTLDSLPDNEDEKSVPAAILPLLRADTAA